MKVIEMTRKLKLRNVVAIVTCLTVSIMFLSCKDKNSNDSNADTVDKPETPIMTVTTDKPVTPIMTMTTAMKGYVSIALKGTGEATIDWGDGTPKKTFTLTKSAKEYRHKYSGKTANTITIVGENITFLTCANNELTSLDVSNNTALTFLTCIGNKLTNLDVSKNTALTELDCTANKLTSLDVSNNTALIELYCHYNQLTSLDVSKNTALIKLHCGNGDNKLTTLDVSKNTALTELGCSGNELTKLDVSSNKALTYLDCEKNQLTYLDLSNNTALFNLYCNNNELTSLDVNKNRALKYLNCGNNELTKLNVSKNKAITYLNCESNQLTNLDLSNNTALEYLYCNNNQLTNLDLSNNTALRYLYCNNNQFTSLDVSNNTMLEYLDFNNNQVTTLDVSGVRFDMIFVKGKGEIKDFQIGKYEVTQAQWQAIMGNNPSSFTGYDLPVETVSWNDAQEFITKLNTTSGKKFRLPTQAEWEYAARGGIKSKGYQYSGSNNINDVAWYNGNSNSRPHPVGTKAPNELGIYDMSGNVWEWCLDIDGTLRLYLGGCWYYGDEYSRLAFHNSFNPDGRYYNLGFRIVLQ